LRLVRIGAGRIAGQRLDIDPSAGLNAGTMQNKCVVLAIACGLVLVSCRKKDDDIPPMPTQTATAEPAPTVEQVPEAAAPSVVRPELDNRADGITGTALTVTGAKASIQVPQGWQLAKGETQVSSAADQKVRIAATSVGPEGAASKLDKAASAQGLAGCQWASIENVTVGKDKLTAQAADGTCTRAGAQVPAAYMTTEGLLVMGSWDEGADRAPVFGAMRSVAKLAAGGGDSSGIAACCAALSQNVKSAPPAQIPLYMSAIAVCNSVRNSPQGRAALAQVRAALASAAVPASCL
jgi:hypothetical protein